jgi:hypothetical protein
VKPRGWTAAAAATLALAACAAAPGGAVRQFGGMREVMRDGHTEARVRLADLEFARDTIAVGALDGLRGEITAASGTVWVANAADGAFHAEPVTAATAATLLTIATPDLIVARTCDAALDEATLAALVRATGLPLPATIDVEGDAATLALHVARGACPHGEATPATEPWRWNAPAGTAVRLVGFFAPDREGVMTHHGTAFHLHAIARAGDGQVITGHVDSFALQPGARVRIGGTTR